MSTISPARELDLQITRPMSPAQASASDGPPATAEYALHERSGVAAKVRVLTS